MNRRIMTGLLALIALGGGAGWHYRATIKAWMSPPASASNPAATPDVLYSWTDKEGVTHYSQSPGKGNRVEYDGSRITPVDVVEAPVLPPPEELAETGGSTGNPVLDMRREMERNAQTMREVKEAQQGL